MADEQDAAVVFFGEALQALEEGFGFLGLFGEVGVHGIDDEQAGLSLAQGFVEERQRKGAGGNLQKKMEVLGIAAEGVEAGAEDVGGTITAAQIDHSGRRPSVVGLRPDGFLGFGRLRDVRDGGANAWLFVRVYRAAGGDGGGRRPSVAGLPRRAGTGRPDGFLGFGRFRDA
jgi:hypothetical protein